MGLLYGVTYANPVDGWAETEEAEINSDPYGLDESMRHYGGPRAGLGAFLATLRSGNPDPEFETLKLVQRRRSIHHMRGFSYVAQSYKGLIGEAPEPQVSCALVQRTVTLTSSTGSVQMTYMGTETSWKYATRKHHAYPRFPNQIVMIAGAGSVLDVQGATNPDIQQASIIDSIVSANSMSTVAATTFRYGVEIVQTVFSQLSDGGGWQNSEANEIRVYDARRTLPKISMIDIGTGVIRR